MYNWAALQKQLCRTPTFRKAGGTSHGVFRINKKVAFYKLAVLSVFSENTLSTLAFYFILLLKQFVNNDLGITIICYYFCHAQFPNSSKMSAQS